MGTPIICYINSMRLNTNENYWADKKDIPLLWGDFSDDEKKQINLSVLAFTKVCMIQVKQNRK